MILRKRTSHLFTSLLALMLAFVIDVSGQDRFTQLEKKLKDLSQSQAPGLQNQVDVSVNSASVQEFVRGIAITNGLNVSIDPEVSARVINNFSNVNVADVFVYLCRKYELDIVFDGPIMSFVPYKAPAPPKIEYVAKEVQLEYDKKTNLITLDLNNDSIARVVKALTKVADKNVVFTPEISGMKLSGYIQKMPFANAIDKIALVNNLKVSQTEDGFYVLEKGNPANKTDENGNVTALKKVKNEKEIKGLTLNVDPATGLINMEANGVLVSEVIAEVSSQLNNSYFLFSEIKGATTLKISDFTYDEFLTYLLNGTVYTFKRHGDVYLLGERSMEGLRASKIVQLKYRSIEHVLDVVPDELKKGLTIKIYEDLNSLVLSGSQPGIEELEMFLRDVDRVVPNVAIEVIIADVRKTKSVSTGIEAGLGQEPIATSGALYPEVNMALGSKAINNLISGINGLGVVKLGKVTPNFYLTLKALENKGVLRLKSTPQIATLNGREAQLNIGKTEYYLEITNNIIGNQIPQTAVTQQYKPVNADLSLSIKPFVSGDDQITLDIEVNQSNFTERISPTAPPGTISRDFKSSIRVKSGEMIMLGGLNESSVNDSGNGVPVLSEIPIIKWFFSSRTKSKSDNKLTIFIKPTVLY